MCRSNRSRCSGISQSLGSRVRQRLTPPITKLLRLWWQIVNKIHFFLMDYVRRQMNDRKNAFNECFSWRKFCWRTQQNNALSHWIKKLLNLNLNSLMLSIDILVFVHFIDRLLSQFVHFSTGVTGSEVHTCLQLMARPTAHAYSQLQPSPPKVRVFDV